MMVTLFLIMGTLAAFSVGKNNGARCNICMTVLSIGCFVLAVVVEKL